MFKYLRPFTVFILTAAFCAHPAETIARTDNDMSLKLKTIVIDAGHGGKDPGALSRDRKHKESAINLEVARRFGQKIEKEYPEVKVIYTRTTDKFLELNERAAIANRNNANLFISIHVNAQDGGTSASGFSAHILGQRSKSNPNNKNDYFESNLNVTKRENSVILLEDDYTTKYADFDPDNPASSILFTLLQNANYEQSLSFAAEIEKQMKKGPITRDRSISQDIFYLLWKTKMPSVLVELGFISNPSDLKTLISSSGQEAIAGRLFEAFREFKRKYDGSLDIQAPAPVESNAAVNASAPRKTEISSGERYGIQIFILSRSIPASDRAFKGYEATEYVTENKHKYVVCECGSAQEALDAFKKVKKDFPDAFPVIIRDGAVDRYRQN